MPDENHYTTPAGSHRDINHPAGPGRRVAPVSYFEIAAFTSVITALAGSVLFLITMAFFSTNTGKSVGLFALWMVAVVSSGIVIVPLSLVLAYPLMVAMDKMPDAVWIAAGLVAAVACALLAKAFFSASTLFLLAITLPYGLVFGVTAVIFRRKTMPASGRG